MTSGAPVASTDAALRAPSSPAASGWSRLYTPAEPQQVPGSAGSTSSSPGMRAEQLTGLAPDALRVPQVTGLVIDGGDRERMPHGPRAAVGSQLGQELAEVAHAPGEPRGPAGPLRRVRA